VAVLAVRMKARAAVEALLLRRAKLVRRLLARTGRDRAPLPEIIQVEATNLCNARCVFCPRDLMERQQGVMDMGLYRKILDDTAALRIPSVRLHNYGESLIDRQLVEKIRYAKSAGIREVGLISNGSLLTEDLARAIVDAGLDALNISVDAAGKETFERTRVGLKYDRVMENIEGLVRVRRERGARRPKLILSFVRQDNSADERAFIETWSRVADKVHVTDLHNWAGTLHARSDVRFPCYRPWLTFTVLWDGRVSLCCADFDGKVILGDLRVQTIAEVWNGDRFLAARRAHLDHGGPEICHACDLPKKDSPLWIKKLV
jgi:MoaA/NifB/PqqE/SkfB family radical SAM enzyme